MVRFGFRAASSLIWGDGGLLFHFTLSKIVVPGPIKRSFAEETQKLRVQPLLFFFSSFLSPRSVYFPFPCSFLGGFLGSFCLRLLVFFSVKRLQFSFGTFFKIQQDNALGFTVTYTLILINVPTSYILKYT